MTKWVAPKIVSNHENPNKQGAVKPLCHASEAFPIRRKQARYDEGSVFRRYDNRPASGGLCPTLLRLCPRSNYFRASNSKCARDRCHQTALSQNCADYLLPSQFRLSQTQPHAQTRLTWRRQKDFVLAAVSSMTMT